MFKKIIGIVLAVMISLSLPVAALAGKEGDRNNNSPPVKATIVMVIDGLQQKHLLGDGTPNFAGLINSGTTVQKVINTPQNLTGAISCLLVGNSNTPEKSIKDFLEKKESSGTKTLLVDGTGSDLESLCPEASIVKETPVQKGNYQLTQAALKEMKFEKDLFGLITLSLLEARTSSNNSPVSRLDNQLGLLLNHLRKNNMLANTLIMVTGSDGNPPIIMHGRGIRSKTKVPAGSFTDASATLHYADHGKPPAYGMVFYEAVEPGGNVSHNYLLELRVAELSEAYANITGEIEKMRLEQREVKRQQFQLDHEKKRYTKVIDSQKEEINKLQLKMKLVKGLIYLLLLLFFVSLYIEYRILKKCFLFFT
jgi:hypothetical protein